jgi:imidazolonepropionase-like amidohydrolase
VKNQTRQFGQLLPLVNLMHRSGVRLLAGSDFAVSIHEELELLVLAGLTPMQAILAATANPAEVLGQHELGKLKTGNRADFVVLEADPLADIRNTRKIAAVVSRGRVFNRPELDRILASAAEEAAQT